MASTAIVGKGTVLTFKADTTVTAATSITTVGNVISISGPSQSREFYDVSTMDSDNYREFLPGLIDAGEVSFDVNYDGSSTNSSWLNSQLTQTAQVVTITFPLQAATNTTNSSYANTGFVSQLGHAIPFDDKITQQVSIKFAGASTFTPESA